LSVDRALALSVGGFDENFIPPVSFRFETEFAKRLIAAGGKIRFSPEASIRHLRISTGGTRSRGSHMASFSPLHGAGDYYYALRCGKGLDRILYMLRRPFREVRTKFHLLHPWWIPVKFIGELRAMALAFRLDKTGPRLLLKETGRDESKAFYDAQYQGSQYAAHSSSESHPFYADLKQLLSHYGNVRGKWLEVGCGRGVLQNVVEDYTGVDISSAVSSCMKKPFFCASAEALPFEDGLFDGVWSYAVLEHVDNPEQALQEIRRVLKPDGILLLSPAWQCRPWAGRDYAWKPFCELSLPDRIRKMLIPIRDSVAVRACSVFPRRFFHLAAYLLKQSPVRFYSRPLTPNYSGYQVIDADARHHMDPFDTILWFRSRGDRVLSHPGWLRAFFVRTGTIVVEVEKV
jgi:SAM-dependent methyltransferase